MDGDTSIEASDPSPEEPPAPPHNELPSSEEQPTAPPMPQPRPGRSLSEPPSPSNDPPEIAKLGKVIRQLIRDHDTLKLQLESAIRKHREDAAGFSEERRILKSELDRLRATDLVPIPSEQEEIRIKEMQAKVDALAAQLRKRKAENAELSRANSIHETEVGHYKMTLSALEEDLAGAETDRSQIFAQKVTISSLEDESRKKTREIKELELAQRMRDIEIGNLKQQLARAALAHPLLRITRHHPLSIGDGSANLLTALRRCWQSMERKDDFAGDEEICRFLSGLPRKLRFLDEENARLKRMVQQAKDSYIKLKAERSDASPVPADKMRQVAEQLIRSNRRQDEKLARLTEVAQRQHAALQRCVASRRAPDEPLALSLRTVIEQLTVCPIRERPPLAELAQRILDTMIGAGPDTFEKRSS